MTTHQCILCNYETNDKSNFLKHTQSKKHIKNTIIPKKPIASRKNIVKIDKIIKINNKYKCNHCNILFNSIADIEKHVKLECIFDLRYNNFYLFDENTLGRSIFRKSPNAGEIYIIQTDFSLDDVYKIGITNRVEDRLADYRTGCNYEPKLHWYFPCKDIKEADKQLKQKLKRYNVKREIYKGSIDEIKELILGTLQILNNKQAVAHKPDVKITEICECVDCDEVFFTETDLITHNNEYHKNIAELQLKKYKCTYCECVYASSANLARHNKACQKKQQLSLKIVDFEQEMTKKNDIIKQLQNENEHLKSIINNIGLIAATSNKITEN